jgi:transcriptional regulator with XRE-family HTH domain
MPRNRISHFRKIRALSQRALAERVETSQQQIQRIESGVQSARLELAAKIADALVVPLREVFPGLTHSKKSSGEKKNSDEHASEDRFAAAGIDPDPRLWTIRFYMFDGRIFNFVVSGREKNRLESILGSAHKEFLVFDAQDKRVALNGDKIAACNIMFDVGMVESTDEEESTFDLTVHFISSQHPVKFGVEPDNVAAECDDAGYNSQLQNLFFSLDGVGSDETLWFDDEDGERVYIQASHVLLLEAPLICCQPDLWANSVDNIEDEIPENLESNHMPTDQGS